jgi:hypothetical protein
MLTYCMQQQFQVAVCVHVHVQMMVQRMTVCVVTLATHVKQSRWQRTTLQQ